MNLEFYSSVYILVAQVQCEKQSVCFLLLETVATLSQFLMVVSSVIQTHVTSFLLGLKFFTAIYCWFIRCSVDLLNTVSKEGCELS